MMRISPNNDSVINPAAQRGFSLIELMVVMVITSVLLLGMVGLIARSNSSFLEFQRNSLRIENGRYAMDLLADEINHAGFYGHLHQSSNFTGAALPVPCATTITAQENALKVPIQAYDGAGNDPTVSGDNPAGCLAGAAYKGGSDVIVVRRVATVTTKPRVATVTTKPADLYLTPGHLYLQTNGIGTASKVGMASDNCAQNKATFNLTDPNPQFPDEDSKPDWMDCFNHDASLDIREVVVSILYISSCDQCDGGGDGVPTLKKIYLDADNNGDGALEFSAPKSLVRGVEEMQVLFGVDNDDNGDPDGNPLRPGNIPVADWDDVVTAELYLLVRAEEESGGYTDTKTYILGPDDQVDQVQPGGHFKRHAYNIQVRLNNPSDRRL